MIQRAITILIFTLLLSAVGCGRRQELGTEYGKVTGLQHDISLNGTRVFFEMFIDRGFRARKLSMISPRLEKFDTVVWFPDNYNVPSEESIEALQTWLNNGYGRTLIYVGRDYDGAADYYRQRILGADQSDLEELHRLLAEIEVAQDGSSLDPIADETESCVWFENQVLPRRKASRLSGDLARGIDPRNANLEISTQLSPGDHFLDIDWYESETLLKADREKFVVAFRELSINYDSNQIILVNNGSFLLNYSLVNHEHRKLAGALIDQVDTVGSVAFLESGPEGIMVSDHDQDQHNTWAWISKPPLSYIVPHYLAWGMLFCFVCFPIFGRPKGWRLHKPPTFKSHLIAMGKLLKRSKPISQATVEVRQYHQNHSQESKVI